MNFYKKRLAITWNRKYSLKQIVPITYRLEKGFFAVAILKAIADYFS